MVKRDGREGKEGSTLEMNTIKGDDSSLNEEEISLLVGGEEEEEEDGCRREEGVKEEGGRGEEEDEGRYLGGNHLPNIIITPSRRNKSVPCTLATPDPDIQLAEPVQKTRSLISVENHITSITDLCGPKPGKISFICIGILSFWISWILIIHLNKEIKDLNKKVETSVEDLKHLEQNSIHYRLNAEERISKLEQNILRIFRKRKVHGLQKANAPNSQEASKSHIIALPSPPLGDFNSSGAFNSSRDINAVNSSPLSTKDPFLDADEAEQCAESGTPCKFPMIYKGKSETSCVKNWYDIKPWCSIRVGPAGEYISDSSAWGYCKPCSET
ncbi:uncharacterized protein LOC111715899 [Eurytemora carolleeae]|uniref:uncharacterized protein LOC111715899 n=1 Tax=Eurytemora carolleeae TaxID=1294199 RepID=UPI000C78EF2C|nr:uncharacterized protein LOC111715899 [Eurytemora carolleeae]|eukprot:XP_023347065.1 uncharacterized protein LOC111715899 [Eurytemora affinis]